MTNRVRIGSVEIGGGCDVVVQSMSDRGTLDTAGCVEQAGRLRAAGCRIIRFATQGVKEADNLADIRKGLDRAGLGDMAIVADVHFNPKAALTAAEHADKVRINPGNFGGAGAEFEALLDKLRERGAALRIGVNHGSLAPHVVERWGDTPRGMVESAMEYLRVCVARDFDRVVVSMKSSNVRVMVYAYRLLAAAMRAEEMAFPLHLGVTEAGDGEAARVKSAVGIGALLADGLGDTVRVSLTEPPENEIPVARQIAACFDRREPILDAPTEYRRRESDAVGNVGGRNVPLLWDELDERAREGTARGDIALLEATGANPVAEWRVMIGAMDAEGDRRPVILHRRYTGCPMINAAAEFGVMFIDGLADGLWIECDAAGMRELGLSILQAARVRMTATEYIACPGCGRTQYDLQGTLAAIRARTAHLAGLKIGVMGCIVNGPGEMADADYGYVGEGAGRITLYRGREVVRRAIPQSEAIDALVEEIKRGGDWRDAD